MTAAWEAAATRRRLDPSTAARAPAARRRAAADDADTEGGGGAAAYDAFLGGDDDADASWPLAPADEADGEPRYGDGGDYEPTVDDLVSHARAAGDASGEEGPPVAPSPARRLRDLYAQQRSPVASQPPARPHAEPTPPQPVAGSSASTSAAPANPFAGARKAPAWARRGEVPPGTGKFDALHPFGALSPTHGGGEGTAVDAHATRSAGGSARRTSARVAAGSASASPPGGERASARARPTPPPAPAEPKPAAKQTAASAAAAAARPAPVKAATAAAAAARRGGRHGAQEDASDQLVVGRQEAWPCSADAGRDGRQEGKSGAGRTRRASGGRRRGRPTYHALLLEGVTVCGMEC